MPPCSAPSLGPLHRRRLLVRIGQGQPRHGPPNCRQSPYAETPSAKRPQRPAEIHGFRCRKNPCGNQSFSAWNSDVKVGLFIHQQGLDTTTASGRAMFGMLGVFSEFERAMIQARVKAGLERAKQEQIAGKVRRDARGRRLKAIGRPRVSSATEAAIRERLAAGVGMLTIAAQLGVGSGTVQRVKRELVA